MATRLRLLLASAPRAQSCPRVETPRTGKAALRPLRSAGVMGSSQTRAACRLFLVELTSDCECRWRVLQCFRRLVVGHRPIVMQQRAHPGGSHCPQSSLSDACCQSAVYLSIFVRSEGVRTFSFTHDYNTSQLGMDQSVHFSLTQFRIFELPDADSQCGVPLLFIVSSPSAPRRKHYYVCKVDSLNRSIETRPRVELRQRERADGYAPVLVSEKKPTAATPISPPAQRTVCAQAV